MSEQRATTILGPVVARHPLWNATLATAYSGPGPRNVVQKTHGLRTLVEDAEPSPLKVGSAEFGFLKPRLLQAAIEVGVDDRDKLILGQGTTHVEQLSLRGSGSPDNEFDDVLIAPSDPDGAWAGKASVIETPPFQLVAGRLRVWIPLSVRKADDKPREEPWLGFAVINKQHRLLTNVTGTGNSTDGLEVLTRTDSGKVVHLAAELAPNGIVFFAKVPNPLAVIEDAPGAVWARVRLFETPESQHNDRRYGLAFEGACEEPEVVTNWTYPSPTALQRHADALESALARLFGDAHALGVRIDFDRRPAVPAFYWALGARPGSSRPVFTPAAAAIHIFDHALFRINVLSMVDGLPSAATLRCDSARLVADSAGAKMDFSSRAKFSGKRRIVLFRDHSAPQWRITSADPKSFGAARLPIFEVDKRLRALYAEAGQIDPVVDTIIPAFLPIEHGWLQVPLQPSPVEATDSIPQSVLTGIAVFKLDRDEKHALELSEVSASVLTLRVAKGALRRCKELLLEVDDGAGRLRGMVHVADCSPAGGEILPTLRAGATREWPILFGQGNTGNAIGVTGVGHKLDTLSLNLPQSLPATPSSFPLSWQRDGAWISAQNLAQTRGWGRPVAARSLVPRLVKSPCHLTWAQGSVIPALDRADVGTVWVDWAVAGATDPARTTCQIQPALPGIERYGIDANFRYSLRLDLPILDDLFANMQVEDTRLLRVGEKGAVDVAKKDALATAVAPARLIDAWNAIRDNHRLTLTRYRYAFQQVDAKANIANLVMPFILEKISFRFEIKNGKGLPLGSYWLDGESFSGARALAGFSGPWRAKKAGQEFQIDIIGNAANRWLPSQSFLRYDLAGTGIDTRPSLERPVEVLETQDSSETLQLTTLESPIEIELNHWFWFRDVPLKAGVFDGQESIDGVAGEFDSRSKKNVVCNAYEWRLWSNQKERASDIVLPMGFVARPLRLHRIETSSGVVTRLEIVASLVAPEALDASGDFEAGETGPARNLILVTYKANGSAFQRRIARVKVVAGKVEIQSGAAPARFDIRATVVDDHDGKRFTPAFGSFSFGVRHDGAIVDATLALTLFGHPVTFNRQSSSGEDANNAFIEFKPPSVGEGKIELQSARLTWSKVLKPEAPARFGMRPVLKLPFAGHDSNLEVVFDFAASKVTWLGASLSMSMSVDHGEAAVSVLGDKIDASPVVGLGLNSGSVRALFAVLKDLSVSGLMHLSANFGKVDGVPSATLAHAFTFVDGAWTDHMVLDLSVSEKSTIRWPVAAVADIGSRPEAEKAKVSTVVVHGGDALAHRVHCAIRGASVATSCLNASGQLVVPWRLSMRVDHELTASSGTSLRWSSLDEVMIVDLQCLSKSAKDQATAQKKIYAFGARYGGRYRGHVVDKQPEMLRPGLFERGLVAAGFPDALVQAALAASSAKGIAVFGTGVSLFQLAEDESIPLALPWLLGVNGANLGPLAELRQAPVAGTKVWHSAWFDLRAEKIRGALKGSALALGAPSAIRIAKQVEASNDEISSRPMLAAVEQPFFEDPDGAIDIEIAPLFLRTLMVLVNHWDRLCKLTEPQSRVIQPLLRQGGSVALFAPSIRTVTIKPREELRLVSIGEKSVSLTPSRADLSPGIIATATPALLGSLQATFETPPLLFTLMSISAFPDQADRLAFWRNVLLSERTVMSDPDRTEPNEVDLRDPSDRLFVSASLGWPEAPGFSTSPQPLAMGENIPFQDEGSAISGRRASFSSQAGGGPGVRPWLAFRLQPVFDALALPGVMAASPRQLDIVPRRPRLPASDPQPNIVPSRFAAISLGYRPGVTHLAMVALKEAGSPIRDPGGQMTALRASYHPVIVGQDRMPRATVLPAGIEDLDWRRETFILPKGAKCRIERVPAIAFRTYAIVPDSDADIPPPLDVVVLKASNPRLDLARSTVLRLTNEGPTFPNWHPYRSRTFQLRIGTRTWPFKASEGKGIITLELETAHAAEAAAYGSGASGDTVIACELVLAAGTDAGSSKNTEAVSAPSLVLQLPLSVVRATEPTLEVPGATLIFGDPAYDRMLSSMTASDSVRIDQWLAIFATDRQTYDVASPVLVSLGVRDESGRVKYPGFVLRVTRFREGEKVSTECTFQIAKDLAVASLSVDQMIAKGLNSVLPGDRLSLSAVFDFGNTKDLSLGLQLSITREPAVPPAPAVYHLLTLHGSSKENLDAATALSASGPTPSSIEYPALATDLMQGYVRRRGLFVWHFAPDAKPYFDRFGYLVKVDRSGAGQLPEKLDDFEQAVAAVPGPSSSPRELPSGFHPATGVTLSSVVSDAPSSS